MHDIARPLPALGDYHDYSLCFKLVFVHMLRFHCLLKAVLKGCEHQFRYNLSVMAESSSGSWQLPNVVDLTAVEVS